jgi:tRNA G10  N-methylase Trm11
MSASSDVDGVGLLQERMSIGVERASSAESGLRERDQRRRPVVRPTRTLQPYGARHVSPRERGEW